MTTAPQPAGTFNFAFIPYAQDLVQAAQIGVQQNDTGNSSSSVTLSLIGSTGDFHLNHGRSNRGDYHVRIGDSDANDVAEGILITSIANNGRDHGQGQGLQYGTSAIAQGGSGDYYIPLFNAPGGQEYNADVSAAYFSYDQFIGGWLRNSINGGPITEVIASEGVTWGENLSNLAGGVFRLDLPGVDTLNDGVLLVVGGKSEDNFAMSRPTDDGTGFMIGVHDNGTEGGNYEQDPVGFVFLQQGVTDLPFGRVLSDGSIDAHQGDFSIELVEVGRYRLTIDGYTPADGALIVSAEGFDALNQDNVVSFQADGDGWIIETRDMIGMALQDVGQVIYPTDLPEVALPVVDPRFVGDVADSIAIWQNATIDYAFVVGHRGGVFEGGYEVQPENTLKVIETAVAMGVNMLELDVQKTADGEYVILHDGTVDRTTNGTGSISSLTLAEVKELRLLDPVTGAVTDDTVPTLREAMDAIKGRVMVNLDVKLPIDDFTSILNIAQDAGVQEQIVIKASVNTQAQFEAAQATLEALPYKVDFMPIFDDRLMTDMEFIRTVFETFRPHGAEMVVRPKEGDLIHDGGPLFSGAMQAMADEFDVRLWVNTLYGGYNHKGDLNGLRDDFMALMDMDQGWGFWRDQGALAYQTDETLLMVDYFNRTGARFELDGNDVFGTRDSDRLVGTEGDDMLRSLGGQLDVLTGGQGADVFVFGTETRNGIRESDTITDYQMGVDVIDLGSASIASFREMNGRVRLELDGDGDVITVHGVSKLSDITFLNDLAA